jgi:hypothetical protein
MMDMRECAWLLGTAIVGSMLFVGDAKADRCFTPLSDRTSRDPANFQDLAKNTTATPAPGVTQFLFPIRDGTPEVNIDFYYVRFNSPQNTTLEELFKDLRFHFNTFAEGNTKDFGFGPYPASKDPNDPVKQSNDALWKKDIPLKALMRFQLDTLWPATGFSANAAVRYVMHKAGDLQVTCATKTDFVFSTVESETGWSHPVAGNRGFGLMDNGDGTWMFYSKAVDRKTFSGANLAARFIQKDVFCLGHKFWLLFYSDMKTYLEGKRMRVREIWTGNHGPVPFPFQMGSQTPTKECS